MNKLLSILLLALAVTACSTQTAFVNGRGGQLAKEDMQTFFISGLGQTQTIDAAAVCGSAAKVSKVERVYSPMDWLLGFLSFGIYTPYDAKVYCQ